MILILAIVMVGLGMADALPWDVIGLISAVGFVVTAISVAVHGIRRSLKW